MIKTRHNVDHILYGMKDHFQFEGEIRFFPRIETNSLSCTFLSTAEFIYTHHKHPDDGVESFSIFRRQRRIGFMFVDEQFIYQQEKDGSWRLSHYNDATTWESNELLETNIKELKAELEELFGLSSVGKNNVRKKGA